MWYLWLLGPLWAKGPEEAGEFYRQAEDSFSDQSCRPVTIKAPFKASKLMVTVGMGEGVEPLVAEATNARQLKICWPVGNGGGWGTVYWTRYDVLTFPLPEPGQQGVVSTKYGLVWVRVNHRARPIPK